MSELRVRCACGKGLLLSVEQVGQQGRSPQCDRSVTMPAAAVFARWDGGRHLSSVRIPVGLGRQRFQLAQRRQRNHYDRSKAPSIDL